MVELPDLKKTAELYQQVLRSKGSEEGDLLRVIEQALHHNDPNTFHLGMLAEMMDHGMGGAFNMVTHRVALVNRHILDAQKAMEAIYKIAKEKGYQDIVDLFEKKYHIGHDFDKTS